MLGRGSGSGGIGRIKAAPTASLVALCLGAAAVRGLLAWALPNIAHPDETFQYLEQAYRLDTGRGLVPWEYVVGARSWLIPGLVAAIMKLGLAISAAPAVYLGIVTAATILVSLGAVVAAYALGARAGGDTHAWLAGLLVASWCELVALSPHVLADTLAAVPLIGAFAVGTGIAVPTARRMVAAGALFGLAFVFRVQLAPAIAVAMLAIGLRHPRHRLAPLALGFAGPLLVLGTLDWVTLGAPFKAALTYVRVNSSGVAEAFGVAPVSAYVVSELGLWGVAAVPILVTAAIGARRLPLVAVTAGVIVLSFSLVPHKEYRFVHPALPLLLTLCGIGTADLVEALAGRLGRRPTLVVAASMAWLAISAAVGADARMREIWHRDDGWLATIAAANADPDTCGLGVDPPDLWSMTGQVRLRADIPLYDGAGAADAAASAGFNRLLRAGPTASAPATLGTFKRAACFGTYEDICLYRRPGPCVPRPAGLLRADPPDEVAAVLRRLGLL